MKCVWVCGRVAGIRHRFARSLVPGNNLVLIWTSHAKMYIAIQIMGLNTSVFRTQHIDYTVSSFAVSNR